MQAKIPKSQFRKWASALIRIDALADAAYYVQEGGGEQKKLLRSLVQEARSLRASFVRQMEKICAGK